MQLEARALFGDGGHGDVASERAAGREHCAGAHAATREFVDAGVRGDAVGEQHLSQVFLGLRREPQRLGAFTQALPVDAAPVIADANVERAIFVEVGGQRDLAAGRLPELFSLGL